MAEPDKSEKEKAEKDAHKKPKEPKAEGGKEQKDQKEQKAPPKKEREKVEREKLRLVDADIDGHKTVLCALMQVKGIGARMANIIAELAHVPKSEKIGNVTESKTDELEDLIKTIHETVPTWIVNRKRDWETGQDIHITGHEVEIMVKGDINRMKMIRCYRGIRHEKGQKVRGQRTKSNGRSGLTLGVIKKQARAALAEKAKTEEKPAE